MNLLQFETVPAEKLILDPAECAARLHTARGYTDSAIELCKAKLAETLDCRFCALRVHVTYPEPDTVNLGFGNIKTHALYRNLSGAPEAFLFAVTIGIGVDRLLEKLARLSPAEHFITDALASAYAEAACDYADKKISAGLDCLPRFSPGYGDLPLDVQPPLLAALDAGRKLGITLNKSFLMTPLKSVTAVMGIKKSLS